MLFFRYRDGEPAFNTFACSRDLINWTHWNGEPLIKSEYEWENVHAHKTWFVRSNEINYHFYCTRTQRDGTKPLKKGDSGNQPDGKQRQNQC